MSVVTKGIFDTLVADATLTALLNTYNGSPAIFTGDRVPDDAVVPYIKISGNITAGADDTKTTEGRELVIDIGCWVKESSSALEVENIAEQVHDLLHRVSITITGHSNWLSEASPPISTPPEEGVFGRIISLRIRTEEN